MKPCGQLAEIDRRPVRLHHARLHPGKPEDRIEARRYAVEIVERIADLPPRGVRQLRPERERLEAQAQAGERRPQVMGDIGRHLAKRRNPGFEPVERCIHPAGQPGEVVIALLADPERGIAIPHRLKHRLHPGDARVVAPGDPEREPRRERDGEAETGGEVAEEDRAVLVEHPVVARRHQPAARHPAPIGEVALVFLPCRHMRTGEIHPGAQLARAGEGLLRLEIALPPAGGGVDEGHQNLAVLRCGHLGGELVVEVLEIVLPRHHAQPFDSALDIALEPQLLLGGLLDIDHRAHENCRRDEDDRDGEREARGGRERAAAGAHHG